MIHEPDLVDYLQELPVTSFDDTVYRTTGMNADPTAFSTTGGRWAAPEIDETGFSILYTSLVREGAIAEVASYLAMLTPVPRKSLKVHTLNVSVEKALKIAITDFKALGIEPESYSGRNYERTQQVGAAVNFLELDGLIAPSARWDCNNLMIFANRHSLDQKLDVISSEEVLCDDWKAYATSK